MENQDTNTALAVCAVGAEKVVSNELKKWGLAVIESGFGKVRFYADIAGLYRALMGLRAADRVLLEAAAFHAADFDALFAGAQAVPWERLIPAHLGVKVVKVRSNRSRLKAAISIQSMVHKAAAQRLCRAYGLSRLPENATTAEIRVYVEKDTVSLLLDISGEPLFKRGYRKDGGIAPLRESTAAALLLLSGWKRKYPLYDPFCGSGTILSEALMYAGDAAPGLGRTFALSRLLIADNAVEESVRAGMRNNVNFDRLIRIAGSDEDPASTALAVSNLKRAAQLALHTLPHSTFPEIHTLPMREAIPPFPPSPLPASGPQGFLVTNPPYGKRLGDQAASERLYTEMSVLTGRFPGWKLAVITDHPGFESFFGRKADSCREIKSGPILAYFFQYNSL